MKRTFSNGTGLVAAGTALIAVTYGLVRLAYGLYLPETQADLGFDAGVAGLISSGGRREASSSRRVRRPRSVPRAWPSRPTWCRSRSRPC